MADTIPLPTWVVVVAGAFSLWAILDHLLFPGARWLFRRRAGRVIDELNTRLQLQIPLFQRTKRQVLIDRLTYDPKVMESVEAEAQRSDVPREVLTREVQRYAREIVPSFNVYLYFRIGYYLARRILQFLYRVRLGYADDAALARIEPTASIVFLMNHRSNVDYIIVAYMAATRSALSYAVGEWARTWPLQSIIKSLGGFFVRRQSDNPLYRRVLARYVQMATAGGVVQAFYPRVVSAATDASASRGSASSATWFRHSIPRGNETSCSSRWASTTTACWRTAPWYATSTRRPSRAAGRTPS